MVLAVLMLVATYPSRALPLLVPHLDRLPGWTRSYLRLVGPAVLASLAATSTLVVTTADARGLHVGVVTLGVLACVALVARTRNLLIGLAAAAALVALGRAFGG